MKATILCVIFLFFAPIATFAQVDYLIINNDIRLPKDSVERDNLAYSLNDFLSSIKEDGNYKTWILTDGESESQILTNEIQGFVSNDTIGYKPYLINSELLSDKETYLIQIAYISSNSSLALKAIFEFLAHKTDNKFLFSSPLQRNTKEWNIKKGGNLVVYYQSESAESLARQYIEYISEYDKLLGIEIKTNYYFCDDCENLIQALRIAGIQYKSDYNGFTWNGISFGTDDKIIDIQTQRQSRKLTVDPHYLFHSRADLLMPKSSNYYMICAGANVYSGCWGMTWTEIKRMFKEKMTGDKKHDWLKLYFDRYNFGKSKSEYIYVTTFINGLLIEKAERERGFEAVKRLLASGDMYKDKDSFFKILEAETGINEKNFNREIERLVENSLYGI